MSVLARVLPMLRRAAIAGAVAAALVCPVAAAAAPCAEEAAELRAHLVDESRRARRWTFAWTALFGAAVATQLALAATETKPFGTFDREFEDTMYVGASKATVGVAARLVLRLKVDVPAARSEPCADVVALRAALTAAGLRERRTFFLTHLGGTAVNLAGALLLWRRHSFETGALSFAMGYPVGVLGAYTQPRRSWHRWRAARGSWTTGVSRRADGWSVWFAAEL